MQLTPRYDGPAILTIDGPPGEIGTTLARQRRRMETMLAGLTDEQWGAPSRCDGWAVRDVIAHLIGVNSFWHLSLVSGLGGAPTRFIAGFDPAASPPQMVAAMGPLTGAQLLEQFVATNDALLGAAEALDDDGWNATAEAPPGHVSIRVMAQHALWDSWVHERDIAIPLGLPCAAEPDEARACLQYAAAISPALGLGLGSVATGVYAVSATSPDVQFVLDVGDSVCVAVDASAADDVPCLCGDAVSLTEALSLRAPMPPSTPPQWTKLLDGLQAAFDAPRPRVTSDRALRSASVRFEIVDPRSDMAQRALAQYFAELDARFRNGFDIAAAGADAVDAMAAPDGAFVVVLSDETLVGCGGLQHVDDDTAEIKRMWIDDAWRSLGLGGRLLRHLESVAAGLGRNRVVLDTNEVLLEAITMYQRAGYHTIERYNDNPYAHHWFAKAL